MYKCQFSKQFNLIYFTRKNSNSNKFIKTKRICILLLGIDLTNNQIIISYTFYNHNFNVNVLWNMDEFYMITFYNCLYAIDSSEADSFSFFLISLCYGSRTIQTESRKLVIQRDRWLCNVLALAENFSFFGKNFKRLG